MHECRGQIAALLRDQSNPLNPLTKVKGHRQGQSHMLCDCRNDPTDTGSREGQAQVSKQWKKATLGYFIYMLVKKGKEVCKI